MHPASRGRTDIVPNEGEEDVADGQVAADAHIFRLVA